MMQEKIYFAKAAPNAANISEAPNVRISLFTPRFARFEYAADNVFEDRETLAGLNRDLGKVKFVQKRVGSENMIDTGEMKIFHKPDGKKLSAGNLRVEFSCAGKAGTWTPGQRDSGNLLGTVRTLDGCDGDKVISRNWETHEIKKSKLKLGNGFVSRDGWSLVDDSANVVVTRVNGRKWVAPRTEKPLQDWYLLTYGHDYRRALADAAEVFGSQPLPPRYAFGYWYCRYWAYSDREIEDLLDGLDRSGTPVDVMVVDMDWHLDGWTGYTWDKRYFPDPDGFLREMHRRGLKVTLNLHPADGVDRHEAMFEKFARAMKLDPRKIDRVPFDITSPEYMKHYFEILHHPEERRGVDFWWMDWQQYKESLYVKGLSNTFWLNHTFFNDKVRSNRGKAPEEAARPLIYHRWGGLGSHRYQLGFSGDTFIKWEVLGYLPQFTATASNVGYGYWGHDLGGHMQREDIPTEPELYTRWLQYGVFSPIFKTHCTKSAVLERRFWAFP